MCNRPAKGHIGPMGSNCQNEPSENSETEASMSSLNHDTESSGSKASELLLRELITQMSGMNTNPGITTTSNTYHVASRS